MNLGIVKITVNNYYYSNTFHAHKGLNSDGNYIVFLSENEIGNFPVTLQIYVWLVLPMDPASVMLFRVSVDFCRPVGTLRVGLMGTSPTLPSGVLCEGKCG